MVGAPPTEAKAGRLRAAKALNGATFLMLLVGLVATFALNDIWLFPALLAFFPLKALADGLRASAFAPGTKERRRATIGAAGTAIVFALILAWFAVARFL